MTGREILDEQNSRHGSDTEYTKEKMTLIDDSGNQEVRLIRRFSKDMGNDEVRFLFVFDSPKSIKGTALLTWAYDRGESDQWMFLPAQNRLQRIAKGSKKGYFMGTDFTFEDMEPEDLDNFDYEIIDEVQISGLVRRGDRVHTATNLSAVRTERRSRSLGAEGASRSCASCDVHSTKVCSV